MISQQMQDALNDQVNAELYSGYLYLSMAANFEVASLPGFAHWMKVQAKEELAHGLKLFEHVVNRGGRVSLATIAAPPAKWDTPLAAFQDAYQHEQVVTSRIHNLVNQAVAAKDHATAAMLQWFVNEQVEEELSAERVVQELKMAGDAKIALLMLDHKMAKRGEE